MSWFDEAVARRQREQRAATSAQDQNTPSTDPIVREQQEVEMLDPLLQRLLTEYGEHVYGKSLFQKRFLVRLERPGKSGKKAWNWHWHLNSLVRDMNGIEVHPQFDAKGVIQSLQLQSKGRHVEITDMSEEAIQEGLVSLFLTTSEGSM